MSKALGVAAVLLAIAIGFGAFWYFTPRTMAFGMFESSGRANIGRLVFTFGATILGVVLGSIYRQLRQLPEPIIKDLGAFFSNVARSVDLWLGLVGAPIVFALLLQSTDGMSVPGLLLVGLENGFCCLIIVNAFIGRTETQVQKGAVIALPPDQRT